MENDALLNITGFIVKENYPEEIDFKQEPECESETYVCHCEDVSLDELLSAIGDRKYISVDEVKHITRLGMGPCRGGREKRGTGEFRAADTFRLVPGLAGGRRGSYGLRGFFAVARAANRGAASGFAARSGPGGGGPGPPGGDGERG